MTGAAITLEVTDAPVRELLDRVEAVGGDTLPLMRALGGYMLASTQRRFETRTAPGGAAWQRLAPRTARERIRQGYGTTNILRRSGILYASLTYVASSTEVETGTNNPYAAAHQFGAEITHYARSQPIYQHYDAKTDTFDPRFRKRSRSNFMRYVEIGEHKVTIPARPYLGVDDADVVEMAAIGEDWLAGRIGGAR